MSQVDVVIPCYRYAHFLPACVQSVLSQEGVDVRALIIDDCSPDHTSEVAAELAAGDRRVEIVRHKVNLGHIATYNEGLLGWASSEYCLLLSADDMLAPDALRRAARLMDARPDVGFTYGRGVRSSHPEQESWDEPQAYAWRVMSGQEFVTRSCRHGGNLVPTPTAVVRTHLQRAVGGYRSELPHAGDMEMWLRLAVHAPVGFIDANQALYRKHGRQMSVDFPDMRDLLQRLAAFDAFFRDYGDRVEHRDELRSMAIRAVAQSAFWFGSQLYDRGEVTACRELHAFALSLDRHLRYTGKWWRFRCKRSIGPGVWSKLRPIVARFRGHRTAAAVPVA